MTKRKALLETLYKTARGLRDAGLMSAQTMREIDILCLPKVKEYTAVQIKRMRERNKASQAVFAAYLNTSVSTIQKWERGEKKPNGPSLKLLSLVETKGLQALAA